MDVPSEYFSSGNLAHGSSEATEEHYPLNISFLIWGGFFPSSIRTERVLVPLIVSSLKSLEDHLL
jgi:uncharacterized protein (UPF0303 family)